MASAWERRRTRRMGLEDDPSQMSAWQRRRATQTGRLDDPSQMSAWERRRYEKTQQYNKSGSSSGMTLPPGLVQEVERMQPQIESKVQQTALRPEEQPQGSFLDSLLHGATFGMAGEEGNTIGSLVGSILPITLASYTGGTILPMLTGFGKAAQAARAGGAAASALGLGTKVGLGATRLAGTGATYALGEQLAASARGEETDPTQIIKSGITSGLIGAAFPALGSLWQKFRGPAAKGVSAAADKARQANMAQLSTSRTVGGATMGPRLGEFARQSGASGARYDLGGVASLQKGSLTNSILRTFGVETYQQLPIRPIAKGLTPKKLYSEALKLERYAGNVRRGTAMGDVLQRYGKGGYPSLPIPRGKADYSAAKNAVINYQKALEFEAAGMPGKAFAKSDLSTLFAKQAAGPEIRRAVENLRGTGFSNSMANALAPARDAARQLESIVPPAIFESGFQKNTLAQDIDRVLRDATGESIRMRSQAIDGTVNFNNLSTFQQKMVEYGGNLTSIMRTMGKTGRQMAALVDDGVRMATGLKGTLSSRYVESAFYKLSPKSANKVAKVLDGAAPYSSLTTQAEINAFAQTKSTLNTLIGRMQKMGVQHLDDAGNPAGIIQRVKQFFPRYVDKKKIQILKDTVFRDLNLSKKTTLETALRKIAAHPKYGKNSLAFRVINSYYKMGGKATSGARSEVKILEHLMDRVNKTRHTMSSGPRVNALFQRQHQFVPFELLKDPKESLLLYLNDTADVMAFQQAFGNTSSPLAKLAPLIQQLESEYPRHITDKLVGGIKTLVGNQPAKIPEWVGGILSLNTYRLLGLASISNASQTLNTMTLAGVKNTAKGLLKMARNKQEASAIARLAGAMANPREVQQMYQKLMYEGMMPDSFLAKTVRKGANMVMNLSGFNAIESYNQTVAANVGYREWGPDLAKQLYSGRNVKRISRLFTQMGINPKRIMSSGVLNDHERLQVGSWLLKQTQFPQTMAEIPLWTNHPAGKVFFQFSRFIYQQTKFLKKHVWDNAKRYMETGGQDGTITPILTYATLGGAAGYAIGTIRDTISGYEPPDDQTLLGSYLDALGWVGGFGLWGNVTRAMQGSPAEGLVSLAGPSAGLAVEALGGIQGVAQMGTGLADFMTSEEPEPGLEQMAGGLRRAARGAMDVAMPSFIGRPLQHGEVPGGIEVPALQKIMSPQAYDPTGAKEASREYTTFTERIDDALLQYMTTGSQEPITQMMERAAEEEFMVTPQVLENRMQSQGFQRRLILRLLRMTNDPRERAQLRRMLEAMQTEKELQTIRSVPTPARGQVDITSLLQR